MRQPGAETEGPAPEPNQISPQTDAAEEAPAEGPTDTETGAPAETTPVAEDAVEA